MSLQVIMKMIMENNFSAQSCPCKRFCNMRSVCWMMFVCALPSANLIQYVLVIKIKLLSNVPLAGWILLLVVVVDARWLCFHFGPLSAAAPKFGWGNSWHHIRKQVEYIKLMIWCSFRLAPYLAPDRTQGSKTLNVNSHVQTTVVLLHPKNHPHTIAQPFNNQEPPWN